MITLTASAAEAARNALAEADEPALGIRITAKTGGCHGPSYSLELDEAEAGDQIMEFEGGKLIVATEVLSTLEGVSLDFVEDGFVFNAPNRGKGGCGCGGRGHG